MYGTKTICPEGAMLDLLVENGRVVAPHGAGA
jgi:hypothetical protein